MNIIFIVMIILILAYAAIWIARKLKISEVVTLILLGLIMGISVIKDNFLAPHIPILFNVGDIGLLCLMFLAGLESEWKVLWDEEREATIISIFGSLTSLLLGFLVSMLLGFSPITSLVVGICISITAEGTTAKVLLELKKLKTKVGSAIMGAGIIDDIVGLSLFIFISYMLKQSYFKEDVLIAGAIMAFFIGIVLQAELRKRREVLKGIETSLLFLLVPFFFISAGIDFDITSLSPQPYVFVILLLVAIIGKITGVFLTKPFVGFNWKQLHLIGWSMSSHGAVGIALALIAFRSGYLVPDVYSSLVLVTLLTTLIFPFVISAIIRKGPEIMN